MPIPYIRCPKCGHSPLPAEQALPAACPGCGASNTYFEKNQVVANVFTT